MRKKSIEKLFRASLLIGGVYDILLAVGCFLLLENIYGFFGLDTDLSPDTRIFAQSAGLFLLVVGILIIIASRDDIIDRWNGIIIASIAVRLVYLPILIFNVLSYDLPLEFTVIGITDAITGLLMLIPFLIYRFQKDGGIIENGRRQG